MGSEQQFCLRWNNHQSTLVAVFDTLLESGTLVDCTLAAEGQYLKAHKVVLSACSPYFELLLSQHYEKHPIVILKDVKFQELKAMMDYMYRGEVNISQDQLGALLKAAESLQIKGLSDSGGGGTEREPESKRRKESAPPPAPRTPPILPHTSSGLTIEHRRPVQPAQVPQVVDLPEDSPPLHLPKMGAAREGSISPVSRKRKKHRRRSSCDDNISVSGALGMTDNHETSSSCELPPQASQVSATPTIPATITPVSSTPISKHPLDSLARVAEDKNNDSEILTKPLPSAQVSVPSPQAMTLEPEPVHKVEHKVEPQSEVLLEPKSEYLEEDVNEDSVEDLTLDDDMDEMDQPRAGPSHGGEGSSSQGAGFAPWHVAATDRSTDEVFMAAQEAVGAHRDSQGAFMVLDVPRHHEVSDSQQTVNKHILWSKIHRAEERSSHHPPSYIKATEFTNQTFEYCSERTQNKPDHHLQDSVFNREVGGYICEKCGKVYKWKGSLRSHVRMECGKEPKFQCTFCCYRTYQKGNLSRHVSLAHKRMHDK